MDTRNVFHKTLTESEARTLLGKGINRALAGTKMERIAHVIGSCSKTVRNAHDEKTSLTLHSVFNLLAVDASALDELLANFGMRAVSIDSAAAEDHRLLADTLALGAYHAEALADGHINHTEAAKLDKLSGPVLRGWSARKLKVVA